MNVERKTNDSNGALQVIPGSHLQPRKSAMFNRENKITCSRGQGQIMIMSPLIQHASVKSENQSSRKVLHLEFCDPNLLDFQLNWTEFYK